MNKALMQAVVVFTAATAFAASPKQTPTLDAFLSDTARQPLVSQAELSAAARAGRVSSIEPRYGVPSFFWAPLDSAARAPADVGLTPVEAARRYLVTYASLYRSTPARMAAAQVSQVHDLKDGTAVIVGFQQRVGGVRVFRDDLKVVMNARLQLVALSGYLTPAVKVRGSFALGPAAALTSALRLTSGVSLEANQVASLGLFAGGYEKWKVPGVARAARTRQVYFPTPAGLVPSFYVELDSALPESGSFYGAYVVSAVDGAVLYRKDLTASEGHAYRVWADPTSLLPDDGPEGLALTPNPTGTPAAVTEVMQPQALIAIEHGPISTNDPWLAAGATTSSGNNVKAYADLTNPNGYGTGDVIAAVTNDALDFTYDTALDPQANVTQQSAAITQLFYNTNFFHDWYYDDGFDEAAGNAQADNYGRGGLDGDALHAEAQDYSGTDNANMSTPADGDSPQMQMYIFLGDDGATVSFLAAGASTSQTLRSQGADFGPQAFNLSLPLALMSPADGCTANPSPTAYAGQIVLIDRGTCAFQLKALNAEQAGAAGVLIANNMGGGAPYLGGSPSVGTVSIPAMGISQSSGNTLKTALMNGGGTITMSREAAKNRDGTLDNGVVAHEWGHFISNRLIGDANGISNLQAVGMGEGWADFHASLMIARAEDALVPSNANWRGAFALAGYAGATVDPTAYYYGFRRYPLSVDFAKNPLTFKHTQDGVALPPATTAPLAFGASGASNSEVHNTGEVWAVMLWECYVTLLTDSRYTFEQARSRMKKDLVAAYKVTADMPTFVDARDAVLAVAAASDMTDFQHFWEAFARRGLGMGAVAADRDSPDNSPVTESFVTGNDVQLTGAALSDSGTSCDHDGLLDSLETGALTLTLRNVGVGTLSNASVAVTTSSAGLTFPSGGTVAMPATAPFGVATVTVPVALAEVVGAQPGDFTITITDPSLLAPVTAHASFRLNADLKPASSRLDDVEAPMTQWTAASDPNGTTGSDFRIFQDSATEHFWFGPNPASPADTWLISPALEVGAGPFAVTFHHRWDFEADASDNYDGAVIEVSTDDGHTWTDVGEHALPGYTGLISTENNQTSNPLGGQQGYVGQSAGYPAFITERVELGTTYANQTVRFRFRIGADDAVARKGWEIDDIEFSGTTNTPFTSVVNDPNTCSNGAPTVSVMDLSVVEGETVTLTATASDPDGDPVHLTWTQLSGPMVTLTDATFTAPLVTADTQLGFQVVADDGRAVSMPATLTVTVHDANLAPTASAPASMTVKVNQAVTIAGSGTDPEGVAVTYTWTQVSGAQVALTGADTSDLHFTAPGTAQALQFQLVVSDGVLSSAPALVNVTVTADGGSTMNPDPKGSGCGCSGGVELLPLGLLGLALRSRRRRR